VVFPSDVRRLRRRAIPGGWRKASW
jgi:hypothetical protein